MFQTRGRVARGAAGETNYTNNTFQLLGINFWLLGSNLEIWTSVQRSCGPVFYAQYSANRGNAGRYGLTGAYPGGRSVFHSFQRNQSELGVLGKD